MKLHLPKLLRNAVLACITAVAGITTTVGTAAFTGGVVAFALVAPQAMADAHWIGTSDTYEASAWHTQANWDIPFAVENKGPGVPDSNLWQPIFLDSVTIGSASDRVAMEGWNIRLNLDNGAALYATAKKFQSGEGGKCYMQVNGGSTLDINILDGSFNAVTFDVGADSAVTLGLAQATKNTSGLTINLNGAGAQMNFVSAVDGGSVLTGPVNVSAELGMIASETKVTQEIGLSVENVTLQNLSFDFGRYYTLSDSEITDENAQSKKGQYWYYLDTDGKYKVTYVQYHYINIKGGTLTWDANTLFDGIACTGNEPVMFTTADSTVTMAADVTVDIVDVKDNIHASIGGDETLTVDQVILGEGAQLSILKASALAMTSVSMDAEARLNIATGGETTVQEALGSATWTGGSIGVTNGTTLNLSDSILNSSNIVVDGVGSKIVLSNCGDEDGEVFLGGNIKLQNGAIMELSGDDIVDGTNYGNANKYEILSNSELRLGTGRFSIDASDEIILNDGKITGAGEGSNGAIDFIDDIAATVVSDGTSSIDSIRMRNGSTVTYKVQTGTLTIASISDNAYNSGGNLVKTGTGKLILTGGIGYGGTTTVSTGELVLQGTNTADQLITVGENGTLTIDAGANCTLVKGIQGNGILNLRGTLTMAASACQTLPGSSGLSDGENGFAAASMLVVGECGTINVGDAASLIIDGTSYSGVDIYVSDGKIGVLLGAGVNPYYVNTEVTYDAETMASATEFLIRSTGVLTTGDAGVLSKVKAAESGATVRLVGSGETMTIAAESTYTGEVVIASGTTVELTNVTGLGVNYINNKNRSIIVEDGATLKYTADMYYKLVLQEGATLSNKSVNSDTGMMQNPYIELQGDATVNSDNLFGMRFAGGDATQSETLALNGHTLTKTGSGTFFLYRTTLTAGTIDVQEGTLTFEEEGTGCSGTQNVDIKLQSGAEFLVMQNGKGMRSLTLYGTGNSAQVEITGSNEFTINGMTTAEVLLEKSGSGTLKLNAATLAAGAKVTDGTLTLQGATSLGSVLTIENGKSLTVNDGVVVTLSGLSGFKEINSNGTIPTTNGLVNGSTYKIVDNKNANNANNGLTKVTYQGTEYTLDAQGCIAASAKIFYVVESGENKVVTVGGASATSQTNEATEFYVGTGGTLAIAGNASNSMDAAQVLTSTQGTGTMKLATSVHLDDGAATQFQGKLQIVSGGDLRLGIAGEGNAHAYKKVINLGSLDGIELAGGTLSMRAFAGNVGSVEVTSDSLVFVVDSSTNGGVKDKQIIESLDLDANLEMRAQWKTNVVVNELTGSGELKFTALQGDSAKRDLTINSVNGYTGNIIIEEKSDNWANVNIRINQAESLNATQITPCASSSVVISGEGTYNLGTGTALATGISLGEGWAGTVQVTGANVTSSVDMSGLTNANSSLAINGLTVADGGALTLGGAVTLDGTVTLVESITNNGTLAFGQNLKLDLTGMEVTGTSTKVITLLTGDSIDISQLKVSNLSDATQALGNDWKFNADGTISFKSVTQTDWVWKGDGDGGGVWGNNATNWQPDSGSTTSSDDVVFGTTGAGEVQIDGAVAAKDIAVTGGTYTFTSKNNAATDKITATSLTIEGANTSLAIENTNAITTTNLNEGELVLKGTGTTGGNVVLGGNRGLIKYNGSTENLGTKLSLATGYTGPVRVEIVGDADDIVTWGDHETFRSALPGVIAVLGNGIELNVDADATSAGTMHVKAKISGEKTENGAIKVGAGKLVYSIYGENITSDTIKYTGNINVVGENAHVVIETNCTAPSNNPGVPRVTVGGNLVGLGTVELGSTERNCGGYKLDGNNAGFEGTLKLTGHSASASTGTNVVRVGNGKGNALGGQKTTLELNGRQIWFQDADTATFTLKEVKVNQNTINYFHGDNGETYNIKATLTGSGQLISYDNTTMVNQLSGNISGFTGQITAGNKNTWLLGGADVASAGGAIQATLNGKAGTIKTQYSDATTLSGPVGDSVTLEQAGAGALTVSGVIGGTANVKQSGAGTIILTAENTTTGTLTIDEGKKVQLGTADVPAQGENAAVVGVAGQWAGASLAGAGTFELVNGSLGAEMSRADGATASVVVNAAAGKTVALGGTSGNLLKSITLAAGSQLTDVGSGIVVGAPAVQTRATTPAQYVESLTLTLTKANIGTSTTPDSGIGDEAMILLDSTTDKIVVNSSAKVTLDASAIESILTAITPGSAHQYIYITNGVLELAQGDWNDMVVSNLTGDKDLSALGLKVVGTTGGALEISGDVSGVYMVMASTPSNDHSVESYTDLSMYQATYVQGGEKLTLELEGAPATGLEGAKVNNLLGGITGSAAAFEIVNTGTTQAVVVLNNTLQSPIIGDSTGAGVVAGAEGQDTTFLGNITGKPQEDGKGGVLIKKDGAGTLTVGGNVTTEALDIAKGGMVINGTLAVDTLSVTDHADTTNAESIKLAGAANTVHTVHALTGNGGVIELGASNTLAVYGDKVATGSTNTLTDTTVTGDAGSKLDVQSNMTLDNAQLSGVALNVGTDTNGNAYTLTVGALDDTDAKHILSALTGKGTIKGDGAVLSVGTANDSTFSGSLTGNGSLEVLGNTADKTFTLDNVNTTGSSWNITNSGKLKIDISGDEANPAPASLTLNEVKLDADSFTEFVVNTDAALDIKLTSLSTESGAAITLTSTGANDATVDPNGNIILGDAIDLTYMVAGQTITLNGLAFKKFNEKAELANVDGKLVVKTTASTVNKYQALASSKNSKAGAALMWNAPIDVINASPVLQRLNQQLGEAVTNGTSCEDLLAAVAGASNAVLGMAAHGDLDRQVQAIRNRTTTMGVDQSVVHDDMPYFNAWINAEGNFSEMSDSETAGGYKLNSWGGTVGFDVDFTPTFTAGMALTAMYGDLSVTGVDQASGDLNSYYVSAFARYCASAWTHTFVATVGLTDMSLKRTVMGEDIDSSTDGMGFALMYEVGHVFALDEDATACLQPIFNITWRHTSVNGYDEKGSDLALKVGNQTLDTITLGLGARMQAVVGESMYNRTSIFEARVLAKFDIGDRRSTTDVQLAGAKADIESAERGAIGLEAGAGLTIPLGDDGGNLFMDAAVELRADYMNVNGTVGYRINF